MRRAPRASSYIRERAASEGSEGSRVREALAIRGLSPRKRFGQNFLIREDLAAPTTWWWRSAPAPAR